MIDNQAIIETKFGPVRVYANNKHEVRLSAGSPYDEGAMDGILINRVLYHFSMPLSWAAEDGWKMRTAGLIPRGDPLYVRDDDYRNLYISRIHYRDGGLSANEPKYETKRKTVEAMEQAGADFLATARGQRILANAELQDAEKDVDRINDEIQQLLDQLRRKQSDLAFAKDRTATAQEAVANYT